MATVGYNALPSSLAESFSEPVELDFEEFAIWIDDIAELRERYRGPTDALKMRDANPGGIGHSLRYDLTFNGVDTVHFYEPKREVKDERPDLVVRNFSSSIVPPKETPFWQVCFFANEARAVATSTGPVDYEEISAQLEGAVARAHLSIDEQEAGAQKRPKVGFNKYKR